MPTPSEIGKKSRRKGVRYEQKIARAFRNAGIPVVRTPLSGGWAKSLPGDLIPDPDFAGGEDLAFIVECKKGSHVPPVESVFALEGGQLVKWLTELDEKLEEIDLAATPLLIASQDRGPDMVYFHPGDFPSVGVGKTVRVLLCLVGPVAIVAILPLDAFLERAKNDLMPEMSTSH